MIGRRSENDVRELFCRDLSCSSSKVIVCDSRVTTSTRGDSSFVVELLLNMTQGPYRGGQYHISMTISPDYPFRPPELCTCPPTWHPNIDPQSGLIYLPLDWSPVLKLYSVVLAVQLLFLEPSMYNIHNFEAANLYEIDPISFAEYVQNLGEGAPGEDHFVSTAFVAARAPSQESVSWSFEKKRKSTEECCCYDKEGSEDGVQADTASGDSLRLVRARIPWRDRRSHDDSLDKTLSALHVNCDRNEFITPKTSLEYEEEL